MKRFYSICLIGLIGSSSLWSQNIVAYWDQNSNTLDPTGFGFEPSDFPQPADQGAGTLTLSDYNGSFTNNGTVDVLDYIQSFGGTSLNALTGVSSGGSLAPQGGDANSNNGMSIDLNIDTTGFSGISVSWAQRGTGSGFQSRAFSYSTDGGANFTLVNTDSGTLSSTWTLSSYDLTAVAAVDNNSAVVLRITLDGATGSTGNNRFDNILVSAAVPEPSTIAAILGLFALGFVVVRRRR